MQAQQSSSAPSEAKLLEPLRESFGLTSFRPGQLEAVSATLEGTDSLVILPTGGGKSICFQLPCHIHKYGFTVVVCPLIALAKDQVDKCDERGIYAEKWNSEVPEARKASIAKDIASDEPSLRLLYTTPESLRHPKLLESLKEACANKTLISFAVDEAHTVSEWGHDFRPAYLELSLIKQEFPSVPVAAFTASCTARVSDDIISVLRLRSPRVVKGSFNRPNIAYQVRHKELIGDGSDHAALADLIRFIEDRSDQCGIIYARLRATCDWLASALAARDVDVGCYHAGKAADARSRVQRDWSTGGLNVVVATIAFGMGIDRADVRWVVHWNAPSSMEGFYQESGRAGRDRQPSLAVMYASRGDLQANQKMEKGTRSGAVAEVAAYAHGAGCRRKHVLKFFGEDRGACNSACDQLCDYCMDPKAVQRALSKLEQQESEQGNKAAVVRARMMGIRIAAGDNSGDSSSEDSANEDAGGKKRCASGALWSRATTYGSALGERSDDAVDDNILARKCSSANNQKNMVENMPQHGGTSSLSSRRQFTKRPADTTEPNLPTSPQQQDLPSTATGVTAASSLHARQPVLKRPRPGVLQPFKIPTRNNLLADNCRMQGAVHAEAAAGVEAHLAPVLDSARKVAHHPQQDEPSASSNPSGPTPPVRAAHDKAHAQPNGGGGGLSATDVVAGNATVTAMRETIVTKRRLSFKPPARITTN